MTAASKDQRAGWLATLQRLDEVGVLVIDSFSFASDGCVCRLGVVESITSGGRITVAGGHYGPDGIATTVASAGRLIPADEARARIAHDEAHRKAIVALQIAAAGLHDATRTRSVRGLTTPAAQTLTAQIGALTEALRLAPWGAG